MKRCSSYFLKYRGDTMTRITIYYLAKLRDGSLALTFHSSEKERDSALAKVLVALALDIGVADPEALRVVEFEEVYEQRTGKQLELLTGSNTVPASHPAIRRALGHITSALNELEPMGASLRSASERLRWARDLLGGK